jgi:sortase B
MEKKKRAGIIFYIRLILLIVCIIGIVVSSIWLIGYMNDRKGYDDSVKEAGDFVLIHEETVTIPVSSGDGEEKKEQYTFDGLDIDFESLCKKNPDIVGWIYIPGTDISYPIVQSDDNIHYLTRNVMGKKNDHGAIFMDCANTFGFNDAKTVIYGHRMNDGTMFAQLLNYTSQQYYEAHKFGVIYTPYGNYLFVIIGGGETDAKKQTHAVYHTVSGDYKAHIEELLSESLFSTKVTFTGEEKTVMLSTCVRWNDSKRFFLLGVLIPFET